jgi:hypothetical protein
MSAQVISLRQYDSAPQVLKKPLDLSYEKSFIKGLLAWSIVGVVLAVILPYWAISLLCIAAVYLDGRIKHTKESK